MGRHLSSKTQATQAFESAPESVDKDAAVAEWFRKHEEIILEALATVANS